MTPDLLRAIMSSEPMENEASMVVETEHGILTVTMHFERRESLQSVLED